MMSKGIIENPRYQQGIEKITITDATFAGSSKCVIEPTWINFFFGNNGSGKTTISRTIRDAGSGVVFGSDKSDNDYVRVVYNQDFVQKELQFTEDNDPIMPGVLMLGEEDIAKERDIEAKQKEVGALEEQIGNTRKAIADNETAKRKNQANFENACAKAGKRYKALVGGGGGFASWAKCADKVKVTEGVEHDFDDIQKLHSIAFDPNIRVYDLFQHLSLTRLQSSTGYELLGKSIVSSSNTNFAAAIEKLGDGAFDWVRRGHEDFEANAGGNCPYCQRPLGEIAEQIRACFDEQYQQDVDSLVRFQADYQSDVKGFIETLEANLQLVPLPKFDLTEYRDKLTALKEIIEGNIRRIAEKIKEPSLIIELKSTKTLRQDINAVIDRYNAQVQDNNEIFRFQGDKQAECMRMVWESLAFELDEDKRTCHDNERTLTEHRKELEEKLRVERNVFDALGGKINELIVSLGASTAATAIVINELLKKSGFRGFSLDKHPTVPDRYIIIRESDGQPAKLLSEGERSFIAFLYFYHLVHGGWKKEDLKKGKIVVVDDPVSSMDSGVLFIVGTFVNKLIEDCYCDGKDLNIKQIFVLTHNPYFHKEVSHKYETSDDELVRKSAFFFVRKSDENISTVEIIECESTNNESGTENVSPVKTSYDAMWSEYRNAKLPSTLIIAAQRIVDYHLLQHCSYKINDLRDIVKNYIDKMGGNDKTQRIATEMLRFIYDEMRDVGDGLNYAPDHDKTEYREVFWIIFDAVGQKSHFEKMSGSSTL